jgi:plasmid maintenance system antidote protein VapI
MRPDLADPCNNGTRAITGDTDLCFSKFFGRSKGYFLRLQNAYEWH